MQKKSKKPVEIMDAEWGRLSQRICTIISTVLDDRGITKSALADSIQYAQSALSDVFTPDEKRGRKRRWSMPLLMAVCRELDLYLPEVIDAAWKNSSLTGLHIRLRSLPERSRERLTAIVQAVAPGDASDEMRAIYYTVELFELAAPEYVHRYLKGQLTEDQVYEDLTSCGCDANGNGFWANVKMKLGRAK